MYKISLLLGSIISNFLFEYVVFLVKYAILLHFKINLDVWRATPLRDCGQGTHVHALRPANKKTYFTRKTTYSNRKFDTIDFNKWLILYLF